MVLQDGSAFVFSPAVIVAVCSGQAPPAPSAPSVTDECSNLQYHA